MARHALMVALMTVLQTADSFVTEPNFEGQAGPSQTLVLASALCFCFSAQCCGSSFVA